MVSVADCSADRGKGIRAEGACMNRWREQYRLSRWMNEHADLVIALLVFLILAGFSLAMYLIDGVK